MRRWRGRSGVRWSRDISSWLSIQSGLTRWRPLRPLLITNCPADLNILVSTLTEKSIKLSVSSQSTHSQLTFLCLLEPIRLCPAIPANAHRHFHLSQVSLRLASLRSRPTDILETWEWETYYSFSITCYIQPFPRQGLAN